MRSTTKLLLPLLVVTAAVFAGGTPTTTLCVPRERDALLAFKRGITYDPGGRLASWRRGDDDCCRWKGVRCNNRTGHVVQLRLGNSETLLDNGQVYFSGETYLSGQIDPFLFSLEHLEHLDLGWNLLDIPFPGGGHPSELFGSLKSLRYLNLSGIQFDDGTLLPQLGNLSTLQYLDLSDTISNLQPTDLSWLARLPLLHHLDLSRVNLSMVDDWPHIVNMIPSLRVLQISNCSLANAKQQLPHLNLTKLERLDLNYNYFDHPSKSCWFWNLTSLKYLNLRYNFLFGQFPNALGQMTSLQVLDFSFNKAEGHVGGVIAPRLMRNLCNLEVLNLEEGLSHGNMTELYDSLRHCSSSKLRELFLGGNNITGTLPAGIGQFANLVILELYNNHLTGPVPSDIGLLNNLIELLLNDNNLTGVITEEHFSGLMSLEFIDLSYNPLRIVVDPDRLPPLKLDSLYFASCQMGPHFPSWLQHLAGVDSIVMPNTGIKDQFPYWFSTTLSLARYIDFSDNQINGSLPNNMETMSLYWLFLDRNQITGEIPPLPRNLTYFSISNNDLSGRISGSICKSQNLHGLNLGYNRLEGEFPGYFEARKITDLILRNNMFSGKFPSFLQSCTNITFLDLSENKLFGRLPPSIGHFVKLQYLQLSYNMFSGSIPVSITDLGELYYLSLAGNRLSGVIPWNLSNLMTMVKIKHAYFEQAIPLVYNLSVVAKRQELYYVRGNYELYVTIDLSSNFLTGAIPEEIASLGGLMNLNLSWNYFTGNIPHKIGSMSSLESLDLSRNKLSGEIPPSVSNLTYLAYLDLSYNNLSGRIPSGSQLDTLYDNNPYMYNFNDGLCGIHLQRNCSGDNTATKLDNSDQEGSVHVPGPMFFHLGLGSGFVVGVWVVFCTMLFKKTWRIAYFRLFDQVYDKLYVYAIIVIWPKLARKTLQLIGKLS